MIPYIIGSIVFAIIVFLIGSAWYRIVPPSEAHLVTTPSGAFVASPDEDVGKAKKYFHIPEWIPWLGRTVRIMNITIDELKYNQETIEKGQARYNVDVSLKYRIKNVKISAQRYTNDEDLKEQLKEVVKASVRNITVNYEVTEVRAKKAIVDEEIEKLLTVELDKWGLELINFQLVGFSDTEESSIISDISKRREVEIESRTREENAERKKQARIKEAEAEEKAKEREISKEKVIGQREQDKLKSIAENAKLAKEKEFEVIRVKTIEQAKIDKEKAIVKAEEEKATEAIMKEKKKLEGEGDRAKAEEIAKGEAAPIREKGFAEAEAKDKLQQALNKFEDKAIRALVAEKIVEKDKLVGLETAKALTNADLKVFAGDGKGKAGFDLAQLLGGLKTAGDKNDVEAILNRFARPNDLGLSNVLGKKK